MSSPTSAAPAGVRRERSGSTEAGRRGAGRCRRRQRQTLALDACVVVLDRPAVAVVPTLAVAPPHFFGEQRVARLRQVHAERARRIEDLGIQGQVDRALAALIRFRHGRAPWECASIGREVVGAGARPI
jgi:hypothetical protein